MFFSALAGHIIQPHHKIAYAVALALSVSLIVKLDLGLVRKIMKNQPECRNVVLISMKDDLVQRPASFLYGGMFAVTFMNIRVCL